MLLHIAANRGDKNTFTGQLRRTRWRPSVSVQRLRFNLRCQSPSRLRTFTLNEAGNSEPAGSLSPLAAPVSGYPANKRIVIIMRTGAGAQFIKLFAKTAAHIR